MNCLAIDAQREHFEQEGYVIIRNAIPLELITRANRAIDIILDKASKGESATFHWINKEEKIPAFINDLLSPSKYHPIFCEILNTVMLPFTESLLQKAVRCSWLLLLTGGSRTSYAASLHRDNSKLGIPEEKEILRSHHMNLSYFQAPLLPHDHFLQVVPRSHMRLATEVEIGVAQTIEGSIDVPGLITIELEPGDVIYRQTNLIHQGWNPQGKLRRTLVSGLWADTMPIQEIELRDYEALTTSGFIASLPGLCQTTVKRYVDKYEKTILSAR